MCVCDSQRERERERERERARGRESVSERERAVPKLPVRARPHLACFMKICLQSTEFFLLEFLGPILQRETNYSFVSSVQGTMLFGGR